MVTNNFFKNKKGEEVLSLYWFLILTITAGGIIGMIFVFYGSPYDIRDIEANLLIDKIADCVSYNGVINESIIFDGELKEIDFSSCHLNFSPEEDEYFYKISFYKLEDLEDVFFQGNDGNLNLEASCAIEQDSDKLPGCVEKSFYSLDNLGNQYLIKILVAIRKIEKNV